MPTEYEITDHPAIEATGLTKTYGSTTVLGGVDLRVAPGSVFSLLGPNGAGKTTMVRILSTLLRPDGGQARVAGFDIVRDRHRVRRSISLTGQYAALDGLQTGAENLRMMARLSGLRGVAARRRADGLLERFGLTDAGRRRVATYSGGMRRRLDLAASLAIVAEGTPAELKERVAGQRLDLTLPGPREFGETARRLGDRATLCDPSALTLGVPTDGSAGQVRALLDEIDPERTLVAEFAVQAATLDDVFLALTRKGTPGKETTHV